MYDEEERPRKAAASHEIGQKLDALSVDDLEDRIALLRNEIGRLEDVKAAKKSALDAAGSIFKSR